MTHRIVPLLLVTSVLVAFGPGPIAQQADPLVGGHVNALIQALSSGSAESFDAMAREHFTPGLLAARSPEQRREMVERVHADFGELTVERVEAEDPGELVVRAKGSKGGILRIMLTLEPSAPFRIARLEVRAGDGGDDSGVLPPPAIDRTMSPDALARALDVYLGALGKANEFAGVVLVAKNGATVIEKGYGEADRDRHTPMTTDLRFNIASIGKAFTKVAIGQLVAQGKLSLSDTIAARLPEYPTAVSRPATVDQLLHHTAGIADFFGPRFSATPKDRFQSNADYYRFVSTEPPLFAPGVRNQYCNGCYVVLGEIIARVSGAPYEQFIAEHVFNPAGMTGAAFAAYGDARVAPGFTRQGSADGTLVSNVSMHGHHGSGAGGAYARAADLLAFDNALREGRLLDSKMTGWYFEEPAVTGRATRAVGIAGGAPGANAALESDGTWTIIVLGNLDPPNAMRVAAAIRRRLEGGDTAAARGMEPALRSSRLVDRGSPLLEAISQSSVASACNRTVAVANAPSTQRVQERDAGACEMCVEFLRAVAVRAGPWLRAVFVAAFRAGVRILDLDQIEVLLPVRPLLQQGRRAIADLDPSDRAVGHLARVFHVAQVLVSSDRSPS